MARIKKGLLLAEYYVKGENLRYLPELLHRKGADVHSFKQISKTECFIEIDFIDSYKCDRIIPREIVVFNNLENGIYISK